MTELDPACHCTFNHGGAQWFSTGGQHIRITCAPYTCTPLLALSPVAYASGSQLASLSNQVGSFQKYRVQGPTPDQSSPNRRVRLPRYMIKDGLAGVEKHWTGNDLELKFLPLSLIGRLMVLISSLNKANVSHDYLWIPATFSPAPCT